MRDPFGRALSAELLRLELVAFRAWQVLTGFGLAGSLAIAVTISRPLGLATAALSTCFFAWFSFAAFQLGRQRARPWLLACSLVVEVAGPWLYGVVLVATQGAEYALGSWVPPMVFCALILASTTRLRPLPPIVQGVAGAVMYLVFYFALARGALSPEARGFVLYQPGMQITRAVTLVLAGAVGSLLVVGLRRAIGRADAVVREQELFGKYRLVHPIASGGMGVVFEARYCPEGGFERRVAVKRIHPHLAQQRAFVDAFRAEAELCAHLSHPNVVQVFDFGRVDDVYFLSMEYVDGMTLGALMARTAEIGREVPVPVAAHVARELLAGLVYSHGVARGGDGKPLHIVHRDLCPPNVLLSRNGEVKITDFGIARALKEAASAHTATTRGHAAYLAPETLRGAPLEPGADLFAVGVMLWELVTGKRLFTRATEAATMAAILTDPIGPVTAHRPVDAAWDAFFARALEREPDRRFASAAAMLEALDALPGGRDPRAPDELAGLVETLLDRPAASEASPDEVGTRDVTS